MNLRVLFQIQVQSYLVILHLHHFHSQSLDHSETCQIQYNGIVDEENTHEEERENNSVPVDRNSPYPEENSFQIVSGHGLNVFSQEIPNERSDEPSTTVPGENMDITLPMSTTTMAPIHPSIRSLIKTFTANYNTQSLPTNVKDKYHSML